MLSIAPGSSCDVCSEEYGPAKHPHSLLCGHVLCDECIRCVLASAGGVGRAPCPWCRAPFTANTVRKIHVDWPCSSSDDSDGDDEGNEADHDCRRPVRVGLAPSAKDDLHAYCNLCDWVCSGERYKCLQCPDFDVCGTCFAGQASTRHPDHGFVRLTSARDLFNAKSTAHRPAHAAECDHCGAGIRGVRYKCTHASCPDFDLCEDCEALPIPVHPLSHILAKIRVPVGAFALDSPPLPLKAPPLFASAAAAHYHSHLPSDPVVLPQDVLAHSAAFGRIPAGADSANADAEVDEDMGLSADCVVCDACQSMIHGVRFKCMHETCPDYDLCADCESRERHGVGHPVDHPMLRTVMHSSMSLGPGSGFVSRSDVALPSYGIGATASDAFRLPTMVVPRAPGGAELEARMGMVL